MKNAVRLGVGCAVLLGVLAAPVFADGPFSFHTLSPCRVVDTRVTGTGEGQGGPILTSGTARKFVIQGRCSVPVGAKAVTVNVTAVSPTNQGRLTVYPAGITAPATSTINFPPGTSALANGAIVPLGPSDAAGDISILPYVVPGTGQVHAILDVTGYFQ
jgi:hypothetical protein